MRGKNAQPGDTRISANGYHYTKTVDKGWRLTHHIIAEEELGRELLENERVHFKGSKTDLSPSNIEVITEGRGSSRRRIAQIDARVAELLAEKQELVNKLRQ